MNPFIIPIFVSHQGCPRQCIFCDQRIISGQADEVRAADVRQTITTWLQRPRKNSAAPVQVAFYGGSFTAIAQQRQEELLGAVQPLIKANLVQSIRLSTRPDCISHESARFLKQHHVTTVEIGVQSMNADVLLQTARGYGPESVYRAFAVLKEHGFETGAQLMIGLPGEPPASLFRSAAAVIGLAPDLVRIYPTLVISGTPLEKLYRHGTYQPLSLNRAIALSCRLKILFINNSIRVIRTGLQPSGELAGQMVAGPYHPAFGELVDSRIVFNRTRKLLAGTTKKRRLSIAAADESIFRGHKNCNIKRLDQLGLLDRFELLRDNSQQRLTVKMIKQQTEDRGTAGT